VSNTKIKQNIVEKLKTVDDDAILQDIYHILQINSENSDLYVFDDTQSDTIDSRIKEMDKGSFLTFEVAEKDLNEWLKK